MKRPKIQISIMASAMVCVMALGASAIYAQPAASTEITEVEGAAVSAHFRLTNGCLITRVTVTARVSFKDDTGLFGPGLGLEFATFDNCRFLRLVTAAGFAPSSSALSVDASYQSAHVVGDIPVADSITKLTLSAHVDVWLFRSGNPKTYAENAVEQLDGTQVIEQFRGKIYPAVATGTVTIAGVEYPLLQSSSADIEYVLSSTIMIQR